MLLQVPFWIAAGLAVAAGLVAAVKSAGTGVKNGPRNRGASIDRASLTLKEFLKRHLSLSDKEALSAAPESQRINKHNRPRWLLQTLNLVFFPLCVSGYAASFLFDLHEALRFVAVSGMIGYGTNWLAVTMLFHPRQRRVLLGQGLIPRRREEITEALAAGVFRNLINEDIIKRQIEKSGLVNKIAGDFNQHLHQLCQQPAFKEDLRLVIATAVREFTRSPARRAQIALMAEELMDRLELKGVVGQLLNWSRPVWREAALNDLDRWIENELPTILDRNISLLDEQLFKLPKYMENETQTIEHWITSAIIYFVKRLDIRKTLLDRLQTLDERQVEKMIKDASNDQLAHITLLGGLLGMLGGLALWNPAAILWIGACAIGVIAVDAILTRLLLHRPVSP